MGLQPHEPPGSGVYFDPVRPKCNPPPVSSSDEFKDPFSEDTGGGLLEIDSGKNIQDAKFLRGVVDGLGLPFFGLFFLGALATLREPIFPLTDA
jgi:hypothetical protein